MNLLVNGTPRDVPQGSTLEGLVNETAASRRGVAVAVNGEVVPKTRWSDTRLVESDRIEILTAIGGG